ncbi:hypothetical protein [Kineosporia sp. R_H_3]|uniref:hypothetical protein n=1 Tax=Kineosporia sp. R_H_3 TaxID=1961848 RepID=UPI000B4B552E|nr:hypothetical protein [Kineosporia sp. R_H_3]
MTPLLILALVVTLALLAPLLGTDSRDLAGRGNRGDHPLSPDPRSPGPLSPGGTAVTGGRARHLRRHRPRF